MARPVSNPPNPWSSTHVEWLEEPPRAELFVYEEKAKSVLSKNESPDLSFRWSVNPYRGCQHACAYCMAGETPILMGDGTTKPLGDVRVGDTIYGTVLRGRYRRYTRTRVLAHWRSEKPAFRVHLEDGTELVASGDHRFLTERGWKHVTGAERGRPRRPFLTTANELVGVGQFAKAPDETEDYRRGYLCGVVRGDAPKQLRLATIDLEPVWRMRRYLSELDIQAREFVFQEAAGARKRMSAIRTHSRAHFEAIERLIAWPAEESGDWSKGFLAGIFDAEGSHSQGVLRFSNGNDRIIAAIVRCLAKFGFDGVVEPATETHVTNVRIRGGLRERLRFLHTVGSVISRKRDLEGFALKGDAKLRVVEIEPLPARELFDITTGTSDFIANGVVSHNCYARPDHQYLGWGAGTDFDRRIVVKTNAPEVLDKELQKPSWQGESITFSGDTDCYQPLEASYGLTRGCLEVCRRRDNPVDVITKGALVRRDAELLAALAKGPGAGVFVSIAFADDGMAHRMEPSVTPPSRRFETIRALADAGIDVGVAVAPVIPGLNDSDIPEILERAHAAGAQRAFLTMLRLSREVLPVFEERLGEAFPERAQKVMNAVRDVRGGKLSESAFGKRMRGTGPRWDAIAQLFQIHTKRLGLNATEGPGGKRPPRPPRQGNLFDP